MTELSTLYRRAEELNIPVLHFPLPLTGSVSCMDGTGNCAIGLDLPHRRSRNELRVRLAHELGHCVTGSFYNRCRSSPRCCLPPNDGDYTYNPCQRG